MVNVISLPLDVVVNDKSLPLEVEDQLQVSLKKILRVDSFQKYY